MSRLCHAALLMRPTWSRLYSTVRADKGWQVVIGIEVHAQLKTRNKLFSDSLTSSPGDKPNTHVSLFDAAFPGSLPKLNKKCVDLAVRAALALGSRVQTRSSFDRKHYFYSDLPSGYQITQQYSPIALGGYVNIGKDGTRVRIKQIQIEQDTAKSTFDSRKQVSLIDLNRAGTGLIEIVSEPDMKSPEEAAAYVRALQALLRTAGSSDGHMEQGSLRCDVNVSVNRPGDPPGTRCEIKNLNSVKFMMVAITSEVLRQTALLVQDPTNPIPQETRGFSETRAETFKLRSKEDAPEYRYMPDPNLPPLILDDAYIQHIGETMPELPAATRARLLSQYHLSERDVDVLMSVDNGAEVRFDGEIADSSSDDGEFVGVGAVGYFDALCRGGPNKQRDPKVVCNWITHELLGQLSRRKETFKANKLSVKQMGELLDLVSNGSITSTSGKSIMRHMLDNPSDCMPQSIAQEMDVLVSETAPSTSEFTETELLLCSEAIIAHPSEVAAVKAGNKNVINKITGSIMSKTRGTVDAKRIKTLLEHLIIMGKD